MKLRPSRLVDILARHLTPAENMTFSCLIGRVPELTDELIAQLESGSKSEEQVVESIRAALQKFGGTTELERAKSMRSWLKSLPPAPDEALPEELLSKLDALATMLGVSRGALIRAGLGLLARLPDEARSASLGSDQT